MESIESQGFFVRVSYKVFFQNLTFSVPSRI